jgi:hypothetical protein
MQLIWLNVLWGLLLVVAAAAAAAAAAAGKGLAKAKAARGARALEEAIAAGMVKAKGRGKKMRREAGGLSLEPGTLLHMAWGFL